MRRVSHLVAVAAASLAVSAGTAAAAQPRLVLPSDAAMRVIGLGRMTTAIARPGDVNGDGRPDLVVGGFNKAYVLFGPRHGWHGTIDVNHLGSRGFEIGGAPGGGVGQQLEGAGDFNGDGLRDILVGSLFWYPDEFGGQPQFHVPWVFVVFGKRSRAPVNLSNPARAALRLQFAPDYLAAGGMGGARDVNGDGLDDVIVGATPGPDLGPQNTAFVVFGRQRPPRTLLLDGNRFGGFRITNGVDGARNVVGVGDQNGDGLADVAVDGGLSSNDLYVVFGKRDSRAVDLNNLGRRGVDITAPIDAVWPAGDFNGDRRDDMLLPTEQDFGKRVRAGEAFVVFGPPRPRAFDLATLPDARRLLIGGRVGESGCTPAPEGTFEECRVVSEGLAGAVTSVGDLNGDRKDDLAIGAPSAARGCDPLARCGAVYIVHGRTGGTLDLTKPPPRDYWIRGSVPNGWLGSDLAWIGPRTLAIAGSSANGWTVYVVKLPR